MEESVTSGSSMLRLTTAIRGGGFARTLAVPLIAALVVLLLGFGVSNSGDQLLWATALTYGIAATGLGVALGLGGEFLLGIGALFALSAYVTGALTAMDNVNYWLAAAIGVAAAIVVGLTMSLIGMRVSKFYFAMIGFFLVFLIPSFVQMFGSQTGGTVGLSLPNSPTLFGYSFGNQGLVFLAGFFLVVCLLAVSNIRVSPVGIQMRRFRDNPVSLGASGVAPWLIRMAIYVISATLAGVGGAVYVEIGGFLQPGNFDVTFVVLLFAAVVVGGTTTLAGPCIGMVVLYVIPQIVIKNATVTPYIYGTIVIVCVLVFRGGIEGAGRDLVVKVRDQVRPNAKARGDVTPGHARPDGVDFDGGSVDELVDMLWALRTEEMGRSLVVSGAKVHFDGVAAVSLEPEDTISILPGKIHVLLGPNGSGKTTMLNLMCGIHSLDEGRVTLDGNSLHGRSQVKIARMGVSRSFQSPNLPAETTPRDLLRAALCHMEGIAYFHWLVGDLKVRRANRNAGRSAGELLAASGIGASADIKCTGLTSGQRRIMDVLLTLASKSNIILLDEPAAGLSDPERQQLSAVMKGLAKRGMSFLLVEHDLNFALNLADTVSVLAAGRLIAQGLPGDIRQHPQVRAELLGVIT
jgi:branched-chain amino acid transport system permease protein